MLQYFIRRVLVLLPKIFVVTIIIFVGIQFTPGDPLTHAVPIEQLAGLSPEYLEAMRDRLGLNDPYPVQYFRWLSNIVRGNFGYSMVTGSRISVILASRLPPTLELAVFALLMAAIFGISFGFIAALRRNGIFDYSTTALGMVGISVPGFFIGMLGIYFFALRWSILPPGGRMGLGQQAFVDRWQFLVMPAVCLAFIYVAQLMRYMRASMLDVLGKDYIKAAKSRGTTNIVVYLKHALRNALAPVAIFLISDLRVLVSGTVVIETVFNFPGVGSMLLEAIQGGDMPLIMISTLIITVAILIFSLLMDVVTVLLDPRVRIGSQSQEVS